MKLNVITAVLLVTGTLYGQTKQPVNLKDPIQYYLQKQVVKDHLETQRFAEAAALLSDLLDVDTTDGSLWDQRARSRMHLGEYENAISDYKKAIDLGYFRVGSGTARIARAHILNGNEELGLQWLRKTIEEGYRFRSAILRDTAFASVIDLPEFKTILELPYREYTSREDGWLADLDQLERELKRLHYYYRDHALPPSFSNIYQDLRGSISELNDSEIASEIQRALATLQDGHTVSYPFGMTRGQSPHIPVATYIFSDGVFVISAPKKQKNLIGTKVLSIGGVKVDKLLTNLQQYVSAENESEFRWVAPMYMMFGEFLSGAGAKIETAAVAFTVLGADGASSTVNVPLSNKAVNPAIIPVRLPAYSAKGIKPSPYLERNNDNFWLVSDPGLRLTYTQLNSIGNSKKESLKDFALRLRQILNSSQSENLVIDLRYNNGGDGRLLPELIRTAVWFETAMEGKIFVLMGRNTFSAAQTLLNRLENFTNATFVGEPSGSKPNRFGNETQFKLNYSGLLGSISSGYNQAASSRDLRIWIPPQVPVALSSQDYFTAVDPVMQVVIRIIEAGSNSGLSSEK